MPDEIRAIDCREAVRQLWDYLDDELDDNRMVEVQHHLASCRKCLPHAEFGQRFMEALDQARERQLVPSEMKAQVMVALTKAGFSADDP